MSWWSEGVLEENGIVVFVVVVFVVLSGNGKVGGGGSGFRKNGVKGVFDGYRNIF